MTTKAESLVDALIDASRNTGSVVREYRELSRYIEELERKAPAYDDREKHPFPPPHPGTRRNA